MPFLSTGTQPSGKTENPVYYLAAGLFFLVLALVYYFPSFGWMPRGIHEWAQADRLALAFNFHDNGLNFFRPQTHNISSVDGVVGVEFPLVPYLAAVGAKLTGRLSIIVWYRGLTASLAWLGYYFLFRLVFERTRHFVAALVPGTFLATSPVFAYYAGNFLPDPAGAALAIIASFYLLRYARQPQFPDLVWAIGGFTLATLIKTSAGIYLLAAMGTVLLWTYLQPSVLTLRQKIVLLALCAASLSSVVGYALFNRHLNAVYGSTLFLAQAMPIASAQDYEMVMMRLRDVWKYEYFTETHYFLLKGSALIGLLSLPRLIRTEWLWATQLGLAGVGGWAFFQLMGLQLIDHDYYVLAPYWPGLTLLVALATVQLTNWPVAAGRWAQVFHLTRYATFGGALLALLVLALPAYRARMRDPYRSFSDYYTYRWMQGGAAALRAAHVPPTATVLVLGEDAPNLSLLYFDRRGVVWKPDINRLPSPELLDKMNRTGLDYLLMRQEIFQALFDSHPDLQTAFTAVVRNSQYVFLHRIGAPKHW